MSGHWTPEGRVDALGNLQPFEGQMRQWQSDAIAQLDTLLKEVQADRESLVGQIKAEQTMRKERDAEIARKDEAIGEWQRKVADYALEDAKLKTEVARLTTERDEARARVAARLTDSQLQALDARAPWALVQLESLERQNAGLLAQLSLVDNKTGEWWKRAAKAAEAEVARLTSERDEARKQRGDWAEREYTARTEAEGLRREVARLTEALAAALDREKTLKARRADDKEYTKEWVMRAEAAEQKLAEAEAICKEATGDAFETEQRALRAERNLSRLREQLNEYASTREFSGSQWVAEDIRRIVRDQ